MNDQIAVSEETSADFTAEIRINQSVDIVRGMPVLIFGNPAALVLMTAVSPGAMLSTYAWIPALVLLLLIAPLGYSYVRMRNLPRPERVSKRRIRRIVQHSFLMGAAWAVTMALYIPGADQVTQMASMMIIAFTWFGAPAVVSSIPKAVTGFVMPAWISAYLSYIYDGGANPFLVTALMAAQAVFIFLAARQNWQSFRTRVAAEHELAKNSAFQEGLARKVSKYISPQVFDSIFHGKQDVAIAAQRKKLTVFFSDIERFTETTDRMESEALTSLLNHYLTEMSEIALAHGATIDKYVGDAIMIFFGDPETRGVREDAVACVKMAIAMREKMANLAGFWRDQGIERPLRCRMGVHTDFCTVGNFGSEDRMDYTIIGGAVNIASRLESLATPGEILISYETYANVSGEIECEERGETNVRGVAYPLATYSVIGAKDAATETDIWREQGASISVEMTPDKMNEADRRAAEETLTRALARLRAAE